MTLNPLLGGISIAALALGACADRSTEGTAAEVTKKTSQPPSINSCDDGVEACAGDARCESCLIEGECADGPSPVWTGTACVCTDDNPDNCVYEFCCALSFEWNPEACACLPCGEEDDQGDDNDGQH